MFVIGYATDQEVELLTAQGWKVEDATTFKALVGDDENALMLPPPNTKAVVIFVDITVYDALRTRYLNEGDVPLDLEYRNGPRCFSSEERPPVRAV